MVELCSRRRLLSIGVALALVYKYVFFTVLIFLLCTQTGGLATGEIHYRNEFNNVLLCRQCGHDVAHASDFVTVSSSQALYQRNKTILGREDVLVQLLKNPHGRHFEVITTSTADVTKQPRLYKEHSWFEGYDWKMITCPQCRSHLGWYFEPRETQKPETCQEKGDDDTCSGDRDDENPLGEKKNPFHALILANLIHEEYAEALVVQPKIFGG
ncbi:protein cereblon-like [Lytechinus variegatus]|uniref:protein cereblon-like n=1 Tax=Lytechinus variegatus TaxID=7654 RepID=UPI001BB2960F|nr:protein cereblon-like [Lytechinus variegatus]